MFYGDKYLIRIKAAGLKRWRKLNSFEWLSIKNNKVENLSRNSELRIVRPTEISGISP